MARLIKEELQRCARNPCAGAVTLRVGYTKDGQFGVSVYSQTGQITSEQTFDNVRTAACWGTYALNDIIEYFEQQSAAGEERP